jgi:hypothetical protein
MKTNKLYLPLGCQSLIKDEFQERVLIYLHNETTIIVEFQDEITNYDLSMIFFAGAKWANQLGKEIFNK